MSSLPFIRLYLIRHGVVQKQSGHLPAYDAPLLSEQPALRALATHLPEQAQWHISPLLRAKQSFEIIAPPNTMPLTDSRLEEQSFGRWHDQPVSQVWQEIAADFAPSHPVSFLNHDSCPPGGTSFRQIYDRCGDFMVDLIDAMPEQPQIIVSHAGTIRALLGQMMGLTASQALMLSIDHGSVSCADYLKGDMPKALCPWQIHYINRLYS